MPFLLDTSALSELTKPRPNHGYRSWIDNQDVRDTFLGTPSFGELEAGIRYLPPSPKRAVLERWLEELATSFESRMLPFDLEAARAWGFALAVARREGQSLAIIDSQLAAIALTRRITVVTRNVRHFQVAAFSGLNVFSPWT